MEQSTASSSASSPFRNGPGPPPDRAPPRRLWPATLAFFSGFYLLFLPAAGAGGAASGGRIGAVLGAFGLASLATRPLVGVAVDVLGARNVLAGTGVLLAAAATLGAGTSGAAAVAGRVLLGVSYAASSCAIGPLALVLTRAGRRPDAVARSGIPANLALGLAPCSTWLVAGHLGVGGVRAAAAALGLACALLASRLPDVAEAPGPCEPAAPPSQGYRGWELTVLTSLAGTVFATFTQVAPFTLGPLAPTAFAIYASGMVLGRCFGPGLARRLGFGLAGASALTGAGVAALAMLPTQGATVIAPALLAAGQAHQHPALLSLHLVSRRPARRGSGTARFYLAYDLGIAIGAIPSTLAARLGGRIPLAVTGLVVAGAGLVLARRAQGGARGRLLRQVAAAKAPADRRGRGDPGPRRRPAWPRDRGGDR